MPHGRVIHVLDLLKQAQVAKIAFGVSPVAPGVGRGADPGVARVVRHQRRHRRRHPPPEVGRPLAAGSTRTDEQHTERTDGRRKAAQRRDRRRRGPATDPLAGVLSLGPRIPVAVMVAAAVLAVSVHAGAAVGAVQAAVLHAFAAWAHDVRSTVSNRLAQTYDVDVVKPVEKPEEPPPPPPEEKEPPPKQS